MKLNRKHIGQLFDVIGADGSWVYQLMDIRGNDLLFYSFHMDGYEIDSKKYNDWRPFTSQKWWGKTHLEMGWKTARRS